MIQGSYTARFLAPKLSQSYLDISGEEPVEAVFEEGEEFEADYEGIDDDLNEDSEDFEDDSEEASRGFKHSKQRTDKTFEEQLI